MENLGFQRVSSRINVDYGFAGRRPDDELANQLEAQEFFFEWFHGAG